MFDIAAFLEKHIEIQKKTEKEVFLKTCPWCGTPGKHESTVSAARHKPTFYCFRCGQKGNWTKLVAKLAHISYGEAKGLVDDGLGFVPAQEEEPKEEFKLYMPPKAGWTVRSENYLLDRGLSRKTIKKFGLYYCKSGFYKERIIIPVVSGGKVITFQARAIKPEIEPRYRMPRNSPKPWFNLDQHKPGQSLTIVEGPLDVLKLHEFGIFAICPLGKTITEAQKKDLTSLQRCDITLMQDRDAAPRIAKTFDSLASVVSIRLAQTPPGSDDPADMSSAEEAQMAVEDSVSTVAAFDLTRVLRWREKRVC